jgi:hypothetical protein
MRRSRLTVVRIAADRLPIEPVQVRTLSAAESAMLPIRMRLERVEKPEQAKALVPVARRAAAPFPERLAVLATLAGVELAASHLDEAEAAADRAPVG